MPDCQGVCGGKSLVDCEGVCGGTAFKDCLGVCGGNGTYDCAGDCCGEHSINHLGQCVSVTQGSYYNSYPCPGNPYLHCVPSGYSLNWAVAAGEHAVLGLQFPKGKVVSCSVTYQGSASVWLVNPNGSTRTLRDDNTAWSITTDNTGNVTLPLLGGKPFTAVHRASRVAHTGCWIV